MAILIILGLVIVVLFLLFTLRSTSLGQSYKKYLQVTQSSLLLRRFPKLTQGDLYEIQTTSAGDLVRWILQQEYSSLYINKQYLILEKLMDTAMESSGDYSAIDAWLTGEVTKQRAIKSLEKREPDKYRAIFNDTLNSISTQVFPKHDYYNANDELEDTEGAIQDYNDETDNRLVTLDEALGEEGMRNVYKALNSIDPYLNKGLDKLKLGDYKGAMQDYNKAIELDPNDALAYSARGLIKVELGDYKGAMQDYNKAIELDPNDAAGYACRGDAKDRLGDYRGAMQDYNKAIEINPNFAEAYHGRGLARIQLGQKDSGCLDLSKAGEMGYSEAFEAIKKLCQ